MAAANIISNGAPWEVNTGYYSGKSLSVAAQESYAAGAVQGLAFSSDGTKAYLVGSGNDTIFQYTLSTAWDISTGSYASKSMSVSAQTTSPSGLAFSSDGAKAYVTGSTNETVYQYTLSTAWDISTGSYASKSLSFSAEVSLGGYGLAFSSDGTKAYIVGDNDTIFQYTLSTAWDISTGSYASKSLSIAAQETDPRGLAFSSDGTKAYVTGGINETVYQYTLSTAWDISTGSYASKSMNISAQTTIVLSLAFSSDGARFYFNSGNNNLIYQYNLT